MNNHLQICQQNTRNHAASSDTTSEVALKTFFDSPMATWNLNYSVGIYESNNVKLYELCSKYNFKPANKIDELDGYGRKLEIKTIKYDQFQRRNFDCRKNVQETQFLKKLESKTFEKKEFYEFQEKF
jgi:hypothetical protein